MDFSAKLTGVRLRDGRGQVTQKGGPPNAPVEFGLATTYPESGGLVPSLVNPAENARQRDALARQKISGREVRLTLLMDKLPGDGDALAQESLLSPEQEENMDSILKVLATFKKNRGAWTTPVHGVPQLFLINR